MTTELTEDQIKNGKISIHLDIQLPSLEKQFKTRAENMARRSPVKREANDKLTSLNQEQTVLLMYYLQKERVLLKGEYLKDSEAGDAFEILTGYSHNTLRQSLSKFYTFQSRINLKAVKHLLTSINASIQNDLEQIP